MIRPYECEKSQISNTKTYLHSAWCSLTRQIDFLQQVGPEKKKIANRISIAATMIRQ